MRCPYCDTEMKPGYLHNGRQPIEWVPEGKKATTWAYRLSPDGVPFENEENFWNGYKASAFHCPTCRIVLARTRERS